MFAALCDDDKYIIEELKKLLLTYAKENRIIIDIEEFESGEKLLNSENNYDIIVLDFQLGSTDGLTVAKELRKRNVLSCIIFLTSYPHFMIDAFEVNTFRFLLKPIDKSKFFKAIDDYVKIVDANYPITLIQNKELKKINSNEICFIEADGKYSNIHLNTKVMHCSKTLSGVTNLLPKYCFVRTHRSFVVNLHYVKSYSSDTVYLSNGEAAYLSKNYQKSFRTSYMNFLEKNYLIAVFYFTSKIFVIAKYKLYFILSLLVVIITASISMFIDEGQKNGVLLFLHFVALTFMPVTLGYSKK